MKRFLMRSTICAAIAWGLAACGAGDTNQSSLDGKWYMEHKNESGAIYFAGESLMRENGASIVVTQCDRSSQAYTRVGNQLFDHEGKLSYLYIKDSSTWASRPELGFNTIIRKRSAIGRFDSGSVGLTLPSGETLTANTDVCAQTRMGWFRDSLGNELFPSIITVSMPYRDSYIRIAVAFRQISNGQYNVVDFEPFVQGGVNDVTIEDFYSPSFAAQYGGEYLKIISGTLQVSNYTASSVTLSASLKTAAGAPVTFTANVKLQPRS